METIRSNISFNLVNKTDSAKYVVESYVNGESWYRVWSDGFCEQGGYYTGTTDYWVTINFLKKYVSMPNVSMNRIGPAGDDSAGVDRRHCMIRAITNNGFNCWGVWAGYKFSWCARGYVEQN